MSKNFASDLFKIPRNAYKVFFATVIILILSFAMVTSTSSAVVTSSYTQTTQTTYGDSSTYGNLAQYTWPSPRGNSANTGYSPGPAPNTPDVAWTFNASGISGTVEVFNGMAFVESRSFAPNFVDTLYAVNAYTGQLVWKTPINDTIGVALVGPTQIDNNYLLVDMGHNFEILQISNGAFVWASPSYYTGTNVSDVNPGGTWGGLLPGGPDYMAGAYSPTLKMKYVVGYNGVTNVIYAYDLSNPTHPTVAWQYVTSDGGSEILCCGNGTLFVGGDAFRVYALNGKTGALLWSSPKAGYAGQLGEYSNGKLYVAGDSATLACYNATNGALLWSYNAGPRNWFAYGGAVAYGRIFEHNDQLSPSSYVACWNDQNGQMLWQQTAHYFIGYLAPVVADGKVYVSVSDGQGTTNQAAAPASFAAFDAFSGQLLWQIPLNIAFPAIAYGNLYGIDGSTGSLYCIGSPQSWSQWRGNTNDPGVGQYCTTNLSYPLWTYKTGAAISSSPAIADGQVYIGSHDGNIYCLNAYTGNEVWNYSLGTPVLSSPAVYDGNVYTGADNGYIHCLNATTGSQIWQTYAGGTISIVFGPVWQPRSSPIIANGELYVGALDGKVYCLNPANGNVLWTYTTGDPIGGSPAYSQGVIYIASTDTYVYALNATNGNLIWKTQSPEPIRTAGFNLFLVGSPVVGGGNVYIGAGGGGSTFLGHSTIMALDASNGSILWNVPLDASAWAVFTPTYVNGELYVDSGLNIACMNATNGSFIWKQWLGFLAVSSVAYTNNLGSPVVYVGCDAFSVKCFNATNGTPISAYVTQSQIESSVAIWDGKLYVASTDSSIYCFGGAPVESTNVTAALNKNQINTGETVNVAGQLNPDIPNVTITVNFKGPNNTVTTVSTITDNYGAFSASYTPSASGDWTATATYGGQEYNCYSYEPATSPSVSLTVVSPAPVSTPTPSPTSTPTPTPAPTSTPTATPAPTSTPTPTPAASPSPAPAPSHGPSAEIYIIAVAAAIIIVVAAAAAVIFRRRTK